MSNSVYKPLCGRARHPYADGVMDEDKASLYEDAVSYISMEDIPGGTGNQQRGSSEELRIDYVLVYKKKTEKVRTDDIRRAMFQENLEDEGLILRQVVEQMPDGQEYCFVLIHAPWEFQIRQAEVLKMRMPIRQNDLQAPQPSRGFLSSLCKWTSITDLGMSQYFTAIFRQDNIEQFIITDKETFFTTAQRSRMVYDTLARTQFDSENRKASGILRLLNSGTYCAAYPLHEGDLDGKSTDDMGDRQRLYNRWASIRSWACSQPFEMIRRYFGEKIALYFLWLGYYTMYLIPISVLGVLCCLYGFWTLSADIPSWDVCEGEATDFMMCPNCDVGCDFWKLGSSCTHSKVSHIFDNSSTVLFAVLMSLWATLFLEAWKRRQGELTWRWNLYDFELEEDCIRPEFEKFVKRMRMNPITKEMEPYLPSNQRLFRLLVSSVTVLFCLCLVLAFTFSIILYRVIVSHHFDRVNIDYMRSYAALMATISAACINLIVIMILDQVYMKLAWRLTEWEFPRTDNEFENSFTVKVFLFQFINYYSSLFYIAFFKGRFTATPTDNERNLFGYRPEACSPSGCMVELLIQLAIIMVGKQFFNNAIELSVPVISHYCRKVSFVRLDTAPVWLRDFLLNPVPRAFLIDEYLEMVLQFGFITLFVAAFPLAPLFAWMNNMLEMRLDAYKLIATYRRPLPTRVKDLGVWLDILVFISRLAVVTNASVIAFTSDFIPRMVYRYLGSGNGTLHGFIDNEMSLFNPESFCELNNRSIACNLTFCRYQDYRKPPCTANRFLYTNLTASNDTLPQTGLPDCDDAYSTKKYWWIVMTMRVLFILAFENLVFLAKALFEWFVPDIPYKVHVQIQREKYLAKQALYEHAFKEQALRRAKRQAAKQSPH